MPRRSAHVIKQRRHGALAVRSCHTNERSLRFTREQLDIRNDFEPRIACRLDERIVVGNAGRSDHAPDVCGEFAAAELAFRVGPKLIEFLETRWLLAAVEEHGLPPRSLQVSCDGQPGCAQPKHEVLLPGLWLGRGFRFCFLFLHRAHRIFRLAKPINTRMTVIIQKRTMTFGSAHPFSSK